MNIEKSQFYWRNLFRDIHDYTIDLMDIIMTLACKKKEFDNFLVFLKIFNF